jgi:hypothetical protein
MAHPLDGCREKIRWGEKHLARLREEIDDFFGDPTDPTSLRGHLESTQRGPFPMSVESPSHWPLIVGDIIHAYRSALDYLAWEVATLCRTRRGQKGPPSWATLFPISDSPELFEERGRKRLLDFDESEVEMVERFQPYRADPRWGVAESLRNLRDLSNRDKHRALNITVVSSGGHDETLVEEDSGWAIASSSRSDSMRMELRKAIPGVEGFEFQLFATYTVETEVRDGRKRLDWVLDPVQPRIEEILSAFEPLFE